MTRDEIFNTIAEVLVDTLEVKRELITREAKLYEELGLDSIDAVDVFVRLREITGRRPDPAAARKIRTIDELITFVESEIAAAERGDPEPKVAMPGRDSSAGPSA